MDMEKTLSILYIGYLVPFSVIVPLSLLLYKYSRLPGKLKVLSGYLVFSLVSSVAVTLLASHGKNNMPVMHFYTLGEFTLLALFFLKVFNSRGLKWFVALSLGLFAVFFLVNIVRWEDVNAFNNYSKSLEAFWVTVFCLIYFIRSLDHDSPQAKSDVSVTYVVAGLLLYFSSSLSLFATINMNSQYLGAQLVIWDTHASLLLLMFILFTIGLWKYP